MRALLRVAPMALALVALGCASSEGPDAAPRPGAGSTVVSAPSSASTSGAASVRPSPTSPTAPPTAPPSTRPSTPSSTTTTVPEPVVRPGADLSSDRAVGDPLSVSIPAIGVDSVLVAAGVGADGSVAVPPDPSIAGWFTGGPKPGERGPAVIMGHVDSRRSGPGVFYDLVNLPVGATVTVETTTGAQHFVVTSIEQFPKDQFPTELVYGAEPRPALRLITCGGSFDSSVRSYRDNIIAFLVPADVT